MPKRDSAPLGAPCWADLMSSDTEKIRRFYGELFGWTADETGDEYGGYINFLKDGLPVAGCMQNDGQSGPTDIWSVYLATEDADATVQSAVAHGGQAIMPDTAVGELGHMAIVTDAGGAAIGIWQPGQHKGFGVIAESGTPNWFEVMSRDYEATVTFYQDVFGWKTSVASDTPEFRYTTFGEGEGSLAGIMDASGFLPEGVPAHWSIYFGVEDTDAALVKIVDLGGSVTQPAEDTPHGRLAGATDPTGAMFKIVGPNQG